jgi:hypothetical protein
LYYSYHKKLMHQFLIQKFVLYWRYSFLGCVLNTVDLQADTACRWRVFDFGVFIPFLGINTTHTLCILWSAKNRFEKSFCHFLTLIISIILVIFLILKDCERKSRH